MICVVAGASETRMIREIYRGLYCFLHDRLERLGGAVRENLREHQKIAQTAEVITGSGRPGDLKGRVFLTLESVQVP